MVQGWVGSVSRLFAWSFFHSCRNHVCRANAPREVSKVLVSYGRRILALGPAAQNGYDTRYKGIWICLLALSRAMSGGYVNFGVFELYGDPALKVRRGSWFLLS